MAGSGVEALQIEGYNTSIEGSTTNFVTNEDFEWYIFCPIFTQNLPGFSLHSKMDRLYWEDSIYKKGSDLLPNHKFYSYLSLNCYCIQSSTLKNTHMHIIASKNIKF